MMAITAAQVVCAYSRRTQANGARVMSDADKAERQRVARNKGERGKEATLEDYS
jgi:hypothetical protein